MIDYRFQGRLTYLPGGPLAAQMSAWPAAGGTFDKTSLVAWWSLNETSGTRNDSHGSNHLADGNTVLYGTGKQGNAADFERDNSEYLYIADNAALSMGDIDFTVGAWVNVESTAVSGIVLSKYDYGATQREFQLEVTSAPYAQFIVSNNGTATVIAQWNTSALSTGTWYFLVAWHDAAANTINIQVNNGTAVSTAHTTGVLSGTSPFAIGSRFNSGTPISFFDGLVDEAFVFKRVLTADEKTWLWNGGNGRAYSEL